MHKNTIVTILGTGYVGLTTAALLANSGYTVYAVEPNKARLDVIKQGKSFFYEQGLDSLIQAAFAKGSLIPTDSYEESIPKSQIVFSCVGTPDNPDGSSNLTYVFHAAKEAVLHLASGSIYVQKSTVPVGTGAQIEALFRKDAKSLAYVSNPEFLREGTALYDSLFFDRVVVGGTDTETIERIVQTYRTLETHRETIAAIAQIPVGHYESQYITTSLESAELIKVTSNAFLALKISFANSIAMLADKANADITDVMNGVGADTRIGRAFLSAGRGYGGGCFPKDVSGLIASSRQYGVDLPIMTAAQAVNDAMPHYITTKLQAQMNGDLTAKNIAVLGLAFKAGTSDVRRSPGIALANTLRQAGAIVTAYDPQVQKGAADGLADDVSHHHSLETAVKDVDAIVIATEWPELLTYPIISYARLMKGTVLCDAVNQLDRSLVEEAGLVYIGVGR